MIYRRNMGLHYGCVVGSKGNLNQIQRQVFDVRNCIFWIRLVGVR